MPIWLWLFVWLGALVWGFFGAPGRSDGPESGPGAGLERAASHLADHPVGKGPAAGTADQQADSKSSQFLRIRRDEKNQPVALETAIVRYVPMDCSQTSPTVDLVAAVHIGEKRYYQQLNQEFQKYDAVLYELVAPEGTRVPKGGVRPSAHPVSLMQKIFSDVLKLSYQLDEIDYTPKHFVHADMSPEQLAKSQKERGEAMWKMMLRVMGYSLAKQSTSDGPPPEMELLLAFFDRNRAVALKRALALQFEDMEGMTRAMDGPEGSSLIAGRNQAALEVLKRQLGAGKKKLAIFYGAAHMPDMEKRLKEDFGLVPIQTRWLAAWNLQSGPDTQGPSSTSTHKPTHQNASKLLQN